MPINPAYQFMNADASLEDKNQFLDFLRRDAQSKNLGENYQADLGYNQEMMNTLANQTVRPDVAQPITRARAPIASPRVQNIPTTRPVANPRATPYQVPTLSNEEINAVRQARNLQPMATEPVEDFEVKDPYVPESREIQGMEGIGSWDELEMSNQQPQEPQQPQQPEIPERFYDTTMAKKASEMGMDPRQIFVALAEFSSGLGNIKGQGIPSTARGFYEMQKKYEEKDADRNQEMLNKMLSRKEPKSVSPLEMARIELTNVQADLAKNKLKTESELNDPNSIRSKSLRDALQIYMQKSMGVEGWKADPNITGTDVYKWLTPLNFAIGQQAMGGRISTTLSARERELQDKLDFEAQKLGTQERLNREKLAAQERLNREKIAAQEKLQRQKLYSQGKSVGKGEEQIQIPGYKKVKNVPVEKTELSKARAVTGQVFPLVEEIKELQSMISKNGSFENPYSVEGRRMQSLARSIQLKLKSEAFLQLGVLTGPDLSLLETQIPNTGNPVNAGQAKAIIQQLSDLSRGLQRGVDSKMRQLGFERENIEETPTQIGPRGERVWKPKR